MQRYAKVLKKIFEITQKKVFKIIQTNILEETSAYAGKTINSF